MLSLAKRLEQSKRLPVLVHAMTVAAVAAGARLAGGIG